MSFARHQEHIKTLHLPLLPLYLTLCNVKRFSSNGLDFWVQLFEGVDEDLMYSGCWFCIGTSYEIYD